MNFLSLERPFHSFIFPLLDSNGYNHNTTLDSGIYRFSFSGWQSTLPLTILMSSTIRSAASSSVPELDPTRSNIYPLLSVYLLALHKQHITSPVLQLVASRRHAIKSLHTCYLTRAKFLEECIALCIPSPWSLNMQP